MGNDEATPAGRGAATLERGVWARMVFSAKDSQTRINEHLSCRHQICGANDEFRDDHTVEMAQRDGDWCKWGLESAGVVAGKTAWDEVRLNAPSLYKSADLFTS